MYIVLRYIAVQYINVNKKGIDTGLSERKVIVDAHIEKVYVPMTETAFYILLCLRKPNHGYGIAQEVKELTGGEILLSPGTMYGSLSKMEKDKIIRFEEEVNKRKMYIITELGMEVLNREISRIRRLYSTVCEAESK